jgi:hypothetical protein
MCKYNATIVASGTAEYICLRVHVSQIVVSFVDHTTITCNHADTTLHCYFATTNGLTVRDVQEEQSGQTKNVSRLANYCYKARHKGFVSTPAPSIRLNPWTLLF